MKKLITLAVAAIMIATTSCTNKILTNSKNTVQFPGMTVTRADYKLSKDVTAEVEVKEFKTLGGYIRTAKTTGEEKRKLRQGIVSGYGLDKASKIAVYRMLEANPTFDYLTNIRVEKEFTRKWLLFFTKYNTKVKVTAKGITLNTEK